MRTAAATVAVTAAVQAKWLQRTHTYIQNASCNFSHHDICETNHSIDDDDDDDDGIHSSHVLHKDAAPAGDGA